jgi:hypothetical protein
MIDNFVDCWQTSTTDLATHLVNHDLAVAFVYSCHVTPWAFAQGYRLLPPYFVKVSATSQSQQLASILQHSSSSLLGSQAVTTIMI